MQADKLSNRNITPLDAILVASSGKVSPRTIVRENLRALGYRNISKLCRNAGISKRPLYRSDNGSMNVANLLSICRATGLTPNDLLLGHDGISAAIRERAYKMEERSEE